MTHSSMPQVQQGLGNPIGITIQEILLIDHVIEILISMWIYIYILALSLKYILQTQRKSYV